MKGTHTECAVCAFSMRPQERNPPTLHTLHDRATTELFEEEQAARQTRQEVGQWVRRLLDRNGWVGLPWIASLCGAGGFTPTPAYGSLLSEGGGKPRSPLDALLPGWGKAVEAMVSAGHGVGFNRQSGKRDDRLRAYFEGELPG